MPQPAADPTIDEEMGLDDCCMPVTSEAEPLLAKHNEPVKIEEYGGKDIVQFNSFIYYADELEEVFKVDIIRLGSMIGRVAVKYSTEDKSAIAGEQYGTVSGVAVFEDGEYTQTIDIPIYDDGVWSSSKEFKVNLTNAQNCRLGLYLHHARVKILNAEMFPSDDFKEELEGNGKVDLHGNIKGISNWQLFFEYCKLNYQCAGVRFSTLLVMVFDQLSGFLLFTTLYVGVYIVDTIFAKGASSQQRLALPDRYHTAVLIACWYVIPHVILLVWEALKVYIDIKGASREFLQMSMMRTTMDYSHNSRMKVSSGDINVAMVVNAETVATGYVAALSIVGILGRIFSIQMFIIWFQPDRLAIGSGILMFTLVIIFMAFRVDLAVATQESLEEKIMTVGTITDESNQKYRLFSDYFKRGVLVDLFSVAVKDYSQEKISDTTQHLVSQFAPKIVAGFITANYIVFRTNEVLSGRLSLGIFLASITIFVTYLVQEIADLNNQLILIVDAFACLKEYTRYLNLPLELTSVRLTNIKNRKQTSLEMENISEKDTGSAFKPDHIPINVSNLSESRGGHIMFDDVNFSIPQGRIVAVTGTHNSGKSTLIQLLAGIIVPTEGSVFVPSHLRVLHCSREPVFMHTSMLHNLALGLPHPTDPSKEDIERIMNILLELGLQDVVDVINDEQNGTFTSKHTPRTPDGTLAASPRPKQSSDHIEFKNSAEMSWEQTLTQSEKVKLHIARALVANPEVMIIERTLQGLNFEHATSLLSVLRRHVNGKGLCLPSQDHASRRPRTVIFSTELAEHVAQADSVLTIDPQKHTIVHTNLVTKSSSKTQFLQGCLPRPSSLS